MLISPAVDESILFTSGVMWISPQRYAHPFECIISVDWPRAYAWKLTAQENSMASKQAPHA